MGQRQEVLVSSQGPWSSRTSLVLLPLATVACCLSYRDTAGGLEQTPVRWWTQQEVEKGWARGEATAPESFLEPEFTPRRLWRSLATRWMIAVGWLYRPASEQDATAFEFFSLSEPVDPEGRFCRSLLEYCWRTKESYFTACSSPQVRATRTEIDSFIQACRGVYADLSEEERGFLEPYRAEGAIPEAVLKRDGEAIDPAKPQQAGPESEGREGRRLTSEEIAKIMNDSLHASLLGQVISSPLEVVVRAFSMLDVREVPIISSDWAEVGRAVRGGRVVRFDSAPLLPSELFNMSLEQLARNEGSAAERIPVHSFMCPPISLSSYAAFVERRALSSNRSSFTLAGSELFNLEEPKEVPAAGAARVRQKLGWESSGAGVCATVNANARRLPNFFSHLPHRLPEALGLEEEIFRLQPFLWLGPVHSLHHWDEDDGIYIQLSGHSDVILLPQSRTDAFSASSASKAWSMNDPLLKMLPLFVVHLRPGDGMTIPSRTYHLFFVQSSGRIALNFFLQPKWRGMEFSEDSWYTREAAKETGLQHLAVRQLWLRSLVRLYEETGKGIFFQHFKNEYL